MTNANINTRANGFEFHYIGWKYYNQVKKKAMEQEFSWSGLALSLSIAFFIVVSCALALNIIYQSIANEHAYNQRLDNKLYRLESFKGEDSQNMGNYPQKEFIRNNKIESFNINLC